MENMLVTLAFYASNNGWHTYNRKDRATVNAVNKLAEKGYLEKNKYGQARFTGKTMIWAHDLVT